MRLKFVVILVMALHPVFCSGKSNCIVKSTHVDKNTCNGYCRTISILHHQNITCETIDDLRANKNICDSTCTITITKNSGSILRTNSFVHIENLQQIFLNNSKLQSIQRRTFSGLPNLAVIHLEFNEFSKIQDGIFDTLPELKILDLNNNNIVDIEENAFQDLSSLEYMDLSHNKIHEIPMKTLEPLYHLKVLNLSDNVLKETKESWCYSLHFLKYLNLRNNSINYLANCSSNVNLEFLDLSENNLKRINDSVFPKFLKKLNLRKNNMTDISIDAFKNLDNLVLLDLSYNLIEIIPFGIFRDLKNLTTLDISNNRIVNLQFGMFHGLNNLTFLNLSSNNINFLETGVFIPLINLIEIDISKNVLNNFDIENFLTSCNNVESIKLDQNRFFCTDLAKIANYASQKQVKIAHGTKLLKQNLYGISCLGSTSETENYKGIFKMTNDTKTFMSDFFDYGFKNTAFFKYFQNFSQPIRSENLEEMLNFQKNVAKNTSKDMNEITESEKKFLQKFLTDLTKVLDKFKDKQTPSEDTQIDKFMKFENISFQQFLMKFSNVLEKSRNEISENQNGKNSALKGDDQKMQNLIYLLEQIKLFIFLCTLIFVIFGSVRIFQFFKNQFKTNQNMDLEMPFFNQVNNP